MGALVKSKVYSYKDYDKNLSLKAGHGLWLVVLYLLHPYILLLSALRSSQGEAASLKNMVYPDNFSLTLAILATIPALCFIYAWTRRNPGASNIVQYIWRNGSMMLTLTALLNVATVFVPLLLDIKHKIHMIGWAQLAISILVIVYVQFSQRVKDTFADFPGEKESGIT